MDKLILYLFFIAAGVGLLIYFIAYKRRINRRLQEQSYQREEGKEAKSSRMPDWHSVAIIIVVVMVISSLSAINNGIAEINSNLHALIHNNYLRYDIEEVREEIEKIRKNGEYLNSMVEDVEVNLGKLDPGNNTAEITFNFTLKNMKKDTKYSMRIAGQTVELSEKDKGCVEGIVNLNIFEIYDELTLICETPDGNKTSERITADSFDDLYQVFADGEGEPQIYEEYMYYTSESHTSSGTGMFESGLGVETEFEIGKGNLAGSDTEISEVKFVTVADGKVIEEKKAEDLSKAVFNYSTRLDTDKYDNIYCYYEITDSRGYVLRYCYFAVQGDDETTFDSGELPEIYDKNGNLLLEADYELN